MAAREEEAAVMAVAVAAAVAVAPMMSLLVAWVAVVEEA